METKGVAEVATELTRVYDRTGAVDKETIRKTVLKISRKYKTKKIPSYVTILSAVPEEKKLLLAPFLLRKPVRSASGVSVVAVMCKPHRCPHASATGSQCIYCPGGPDSDFAYSSQSYTGFEPTSMRAIRARYDARTQAAGRLRQLMSLGHTCDKVELILMGGTFMSLPRAYRERFIRDMLDGLSGHMSSTVSEAVSVAQRGRHRPIGLTIETRPDFCNPSHIADMLRYGATRLEVGAQSVYRDVLRDVNRGHGIRSIRRCLAHGRDAGFKMTLHMMPNLPNVSLSRDLWGFRELFESPALCPDGLKLYPTLVIRGTGLYELWRFREYRSFPQDTLVKLVARVLAMAPPWLRIYRVMRDIPLPLATSGATAANIREEAARELEKTGRASLEIRQREVGIAGASDRNAELVRRDYCASGGWETFLSYEVPRGHGEAPLLVGLLRLRKIPRGRGGRNLGIRPELLGAVSLVRELHVYGTASGIGHREGGGWQHQGFGNLLMKEAERISAHEHRSQKLAVISGVGVREYYANLGYRLDGPYMSKMLGVDSL
eukprot:gnl/Chilomastix_cuspidata/4054.p1 GENE.gnl/Chilomastix_cuspidata/4054~~gnl/Chilomastix_cuspidata/4054.p1  ORF type:complete len:548 (+),score=159.76 gnl/Chilomastix_cuspidata/4054:29-1672(+)